MSDVNEIMRKRAFERHRKDVHFRAVADSVVAFTMRKHGPVDPENADREAHEIALEAVATLLERVYAEDGELSSMKMERDAYRALAEQSIALSPPKALFMMEKGT